MSTNVFSQLSSGHAHEFSAQTAEDESDYSQSFEEKTNPLYSSFEPHQHQEQEQIY